MTFQFSCPHGHHLTTTDDRIGKPGSCPDCGVNFIVPKPQAGDSSPPADEIIIFLCPNGHKLNGPRRLQGAAGQCPHCGSKFQIPTYPDDEQFHEEAGALLEDGSISDLAQLNAYEESGSGKFSASGSGFRIDDSWNEPGVAPFSAPKPTTHPLAKLIGKYWKEAGESVEIHYGEDDILRPDAFAEQFSRHSHGMFGVKNEDGTISLVAIAWESVRRVVIPKLSQLPQEFK